MQGSRSELIFDNSGINGLADETDSNAIIRSLGIGFFVRITETSLSEMAATQSAERRLKLLSVAKHLNYNGEVIRPYNWILRELMKRHAANPARFDWKTLVIRGPELEDELVRGGMLGSDELAEETAKDFELRSDEFETVYKDAKPAFDKLFEPEDAERPPIDGLVEALKSGAFWSLARGMYKRGCGVEIDEAGVKEFVEKCPPFNTALLGMSVAQFERLIRDVRTESYKAGRIDLFSAVYLPFCDRLVTRDKGQYKALRFIAEAADLTTEVSHYKDFRKSFLIEKS
jgi:hypothetical protein